MTKGMTPERDDIRTDHWCAGLRLEESRPFTVAERTILERTIALHSRDLGLATAGIPTTVLAAFTILTLGTTQTSMLSILVRGAGILLAGMVIPAVLGLMIRDRWRERARFRADLDHGEMLCFSGQLDDGEVLDEEQKRLMAAGVLRDEPGATQWLDVLPVSSGVMVRRGREVRFEPVTLSEVASLPVDLRRRGPCLVVTLAEHQPASVRARPAPAFTSCATMPSNTATGLTCCFATA